MKQKTNSNHSKNRGLNVTGNPGFTVLSHAVNNNERLMVVSFKLVTVWKGF